jgi:hypothetical protein
MKHPDREEWIPFLFGEATVEDRKRLSRHLEDCSECAREIAGWRRSVRKLDRWRLPKGTAVVLSWWRPTLKWAWAAAVILGIGVLIGRHSVLSSTEVSTLRAEVQASVRSALQAEMNQTLREVQDQASNAIADAEVRLTKASAADRQQLWRGLLEVLETARSQDARSVQALLRQTQERHDNDLVAVRKDLETLASTADEEIRQARLRLYELAAVRNSTE